MSKPRLFQLATAAVALLAAPVAFAQAQWTLEGEALKKEGAEVALPCTGTSLAASATHLYVACETGGVLVLDASTDPPRPVEVRTIIEPVRVKRVFTVGDEVWVETALGKRRAVDYLGTPATAEAVTPPAVVVVPEPEPEPQPEPEPEPEPEPAAEPSVPVGEVVRVGTGMVVIDIGLQQGIDEGRWIEFFEIERVDLGEGQVVEQQRRIAVGKVDTASETRAQVELALNERVPVGAFARPDPAGVSDLGKRLTPTRPRGVWEVAVNTRPFLALSTIGGGAILDGWVGRRFEGPVAIEAYFTPFAFGVAEKGNILAFAGNVVASYDTTPFQVGLGAGVSKINTLPARGGTDFIPGEDAEEPAFRAGFSAAQFVRLGSVDGLHVSVLNNFILFEDEFVFGGITIDGAVPIRLFRDDAWIKARGGGGVPGHVFGELGIRILARGNGGPGSIFLTPTVGGGVLTGEVWTRDNCFGYDVTRPEEPIDPGAQPEAGLCRTTYTYGGPLVGFGVESRF